MWLPAFKYIKGLFALRGEFLLPNGEPYEGSYHKLYNGETYTGSAPSKNAIRIFQDDSEPHIPLPEYEDKIVSEPVFPEPEDYEKGFFLRYFIKDTRNGKIIEVNKQTSQKKLEEKYFQGISLKWILDKPVKDIFNQGYLYKGAATRNKENTTKASLEMKGLELFIVEFDKFVNIESDVEGYKFEELPRTEKVRIIRQVSNIQITPKEKPLKRFEKPKPIKKSVRPQRPTKLPTLPTRRTGGGGGGSSRETQYFISEDQDEFGGDNIDGTNTSNNNLTRNIYY